MPDVKLSQFPAASPATAAQGARLWTGKGHIDGLKLEWVSGTSLRVASGHAFIESLNYAIEVPAAITKSSLVLSASAWYHVYLFDNAGTPDVEIVTSAPATPYSGTARSKTGDASRRYLGSILTNSGGAVRVFNTYDDFIQWTSRTDIPPFRVVANGGATTMTAVSLAGVVPAPVRTVSLFAHADSGAALNLSYSLSTGIYVLQVPAGRSVLLSFPNDSNLEIQYANDAAPAVGANIDVTGFFLER